MTANYSHQSISCPPSKEGFSFDLVGIFQYTHYQIAPTPKYFSICREIAMPYNIAFEDKIEDIIHQGDRFYREKTEINDMELNLHG